MYSSKLVRLVAGAVTVFGSGAQYENISKRINGQALVQLGRSVAPAPDPLKKPDPAIKGTHEFQ